MKGPVRQFLFWAPRILCILFAVFVSLLALDVFGEGYGFWETVVALLMHLIPTAIVIVVLLLAWRWEWIGGILFIALGILYIVIFWEAGEWIAYLIISGPLFLVGALFLLNWRLKVEPRANA